MYPKQRNIRGGYPMLKFNLQFFAHKKGGGSTANGRDSQSKRLGAKRADGQEVSGGSIIPSTRY